jgi:NADH:ubiquinone oxidoreductase subunit 2 (subunit N)
MPIDLRPIVPAGIVAVTGLVVLLAQAFTARGSRSPSAALSLTGLLGALLSVVGVAGWQGRGAVLGGSLAADEGAGLFHVGCRGVGVLAVVLSRS